MPPPHPPRSHARGDEVLLCYGRHTSLGLLDLYGFTLPPGAGPYDNPHDAAPLDPSLLAPLWPRGGGGAGGGGGAPPLPRADECFLHHDGRPSWALLRALRLAAAAPEERAARGHRALEGRAVSAAGDGAAVALLAAACRAALAALPTTVEEDEAELAALLEGGGDGGGGGGGGGGGDGGGGMEDGDRECLRLAIEWRLGYKRMLMRGAALADDGDGNLTG